MASRKNPLEFEHHIVPVRTYILTLAALIILMLITVGIAEVELPSVGPIAGTVLNQLAAMIIAVIKASLVVAIFMGVRWSTQLTKFWALLGFAWLAFFSVMAGDYAMRKYENVDGWERNAAGQPIPASGLPRDVGATESLKQPGEEINVRPRQ